MQSSRDPAVSLPLVWLSSFREPSGYADEARSVLLALELAGSAAAARDFAWTDADAGAPRRQLQAIDAALARPIPSAPFVAVHHYVPGPSQPRLERGADV